MPRPLCLFLVALCLAGASAARSAGTAAAPSLITATDLFNLKQIESPALSPDGRWVVYVVRSIEPGLSAEASAKAGVKDDGVDRTQLWLAATDGKTPPRQLTFGAAGNSSPVWSRSGDRLAFVRSVEKERQQIYLLSLGGGEAVPLTKMDTGADNPRWSPNGTKILFTSSLSSAQVRAALEKAGKEAAPRWSTEKPGRKANDVGNRGLGNAKGDDHSAGNPDGNLQEVREWLAGNEAGDNPRVTDRLNFLAGGDLESEPAFSQFYIVEAREGAGPSPVAIGYESYAGAEWLADGKGIVCLGPRNSAEHPDRDHFNTVSRIDLATGIVKVLLEEVGCNYAEPTPSPDGKWIAFTVTAGGELSFDQATVAVMPADGGKPEILTGHFDRTACNLKWSPDSTAVYFTAADRGRFPLCRVFLANQDVQTLTTQTGWGIRDFDVGSGLLAEVVTQPGNPWELHVSADDGKTTQPITTHNSSWLKDRMLSAYEPHRLVNKDGVTVDYWMLKPAGFDPAKKYPLLVNMHGGPAFMWGPGEATSWFEMQYCAARGYAVTFCNPRGSSGYGRDFQRANFKDWGTGPASDVLATAGFTAKEPYIDRNRQGLTGDSYGGYLTVWILGHDHRFKAAVAQCGAYDLATFFSENKTWDLLPLYWGGYPWQKDVRYLLDRDSPLSYVENITTPLLVMSDAMEFRTGVGQSQMLYNSLKQLGREVEYVRYPRASPEHSSRGEPKQRLDRLVRFDEFFRRYLGGN